MQCQLVDEGEGSEDPFVLEESLAQQGAAGDEQEVELNAAGRRRGHRFLAVEEDMKKGINEKTFLCTHFNVLSWANGKIIKVFLYARTGKSARWQKDAQEKNLKISSLTP